MSELETDAKAERFEPPVTPLTEPYWDATREQRFLLPWCISCGKPHWYPREACPHCLSDALEWRPSAGRGEVYAASIMPKAGNPLMAARVPYVVALVDLDDGIRLLTNIVGSPPEQVRIGQPVALTWEPLTDGRHLPLFEVLEP
jgi:uncharacterized OB-fold protein